VIEMASSVQKNLHRLSQKFSPRTGEGRKRKPRGTAYANGTGTANSAAHMRIKRTISNFFSLMGVMAVRVLVPQKRNASHI